MTMNDDDVIVDVDVVVVYDGCLFICRLWESVCSWPPIFIAKFRCVMTERYSLQKSTPALKNTTSLSAIFGLLLRGL